jgi:hypothetical protein
MLEEYQRRREWLVKTFRPRVERYFANYAQNYWFRELFTGSPDLLSHTRDLVLQLAVIRFLLASHPDLVEHRQEAEPEGEGIDRIAVEVFQSFSKYVARDRSFLERTRQQLDTLGMTDLSHLICLIRF